MSDPKAVKLSNGAIALVDAEDFALVEGYAWYFSVKYAKRDESRAHGRRRIYMHRMILEHHGLLPDGMEVDHINRSGLDNRKANLRPCTHAENMRNHHGRSNCEGYKGMRRVKDGSYGVRISLNHQEMSLGYYRDPHFAAQIYNVAAQHFFGEYAYLNEIPSEQQLNLDQLRSLLKRKTTRAYQLICDALAQQPVHPSTDPAPTRKGA